MVFQGGDDGRGYRNKHKTPRGSEMDHESKPLTGLYNIAIPKYSYRVGPYYVRVPVGVVGR